MIGKIRKGFAKMSFGFLAGSTIYSIEVTIAATVVHAISQIFSTTQCHFIVLNLKNNMLILYCRLL
jgi:hypothetical protein